jgi:putative membrane protein
MNRILPAACLMLLGLTAPGLAAGTEAPAAASTQPGTAQAVSQRDRDFLDHAAKDNQGEIRLCLLAEKRAEAPAVKAFARLMVDDHVAIESQLASVLDRLGVSVSDDVTHEDRDTMQKLTPLHGRAFDERFLQAQIKDHQGDLRTFDQERQATDNEAVRAFTETTRPILAQHLALARAVARGGEDGAQHVAAGADSGGH